MKLSKILIVPALALAAGSGLAACGSAPAFTPVAYPTAFSASPSAKPAPTRIVYRTAAPKVIYRTVAPAPADQVPVGAPAPYFTSATAVVTQFYQDISDQDYSGAWALGGQYIGGTDYASWEAGYATTVEISLGAFSSFGSDEVQVDLSALQTDGTVRSYTGTYIVTGGAITSATIVQTS